MQAMPVAGIQWRKRGTRRREQVPPIILIFKKTWNITKVVCKYVNHQMQRIFVPLTIIFNLPSFPSRPSNWTICPENFTIMSLALKVKQYSSSTTHPTQVNAPRITPAERLVVYSINLPRRDGRLS